eukprot:4181260-Pyramimonas_sp.AAC.1
MVVLSALLCTGCIQRVVSRMVPRGLSVSLEEVVPNFRFLDSHWDISGWNVHVVMHNSNLDFAVGACGVQHVTRIVPHVFSALLGSAPLVQYVQCRVARIIQLCVYPADERGALTEMILELRRLGYPYRAIAYAMCRVRPHMHTN